MVRYDVVGLLGRGGSAVVELAVDGDGRRVATKRVVLTGSVTQMQVARQRLRREAEILRRLAHAGIVPVLDVLDDGTEVILVFPVLAENLEDRVRRLGPLPPSEVARVGGVLTEALAAAHRHGVVHRDIKPANVLFDERGRAALSDFGVAATWEATAGLTPAGYVIGTPMWMAPEQARGEPAGPASDVFGLGATLAFAATGQGPYAAGPSTVVMGRAARGEIRPVPATLPAVVRLPLTAMLDPLPARRPAAAAAFGGLERTEVVRHPDAAPAVDRAGWVGAPAVDGAGWVRAAALTPGEPAVGRVRRVLAPWPARLLGDPAPPGTGRRRRRRGAKLAAGGAAALLVALVVVVGLTGRAGSPRPAAVPARPSQCTPELYLPCGTSVPAPHTTGRVCDSGWYDLDGLESDGCESHSDYLAGTALVPAVALHANLVPASAADSFPTVVHGDAFDLCWGSLRVTLTAPAHTAERLTLWSGPTEEAAALSADGAPAAATVHKPSCFGADSEQLRATVTVVAATGAASAQNFTLTRDGGW